MKKNIIFWVMLVMVLAFGMTVVGCDNDSTDETGGTLVVTDIPAIYNGKYAGFEAGNSNVYVMGCQSVNMSTETITLVQISNGSVSLPMWIVTETGSASRYSGNDTFIGQNTTGVTIFNTASLDSDIARINFSSYTFSNGSVTKSANDGTIESQ